MSEILLETHGLTKEFNGFTAVDNVDLQVRAGTIHALIGPNGAGKTTVFNLLTKFLAPTAGRILHNGEDITLSRPAAVARRGVVRSFQISATFGRLTGRDNVRMALQRRLGVSHQFWASARKLDQLNERADELLEMVGIRHAASTYAADLPYGSKRALEIATTLGLDPQILLLDEPMSGLGQEDIGRISSLIKSLAGERTILMVEHNLPVVADLSDIITVMRQGEVIAEGSYADVSTDPLVMEAYLGGGAEARH